MINVLLSSVGRRVELVEAFRNAYRALGLAGNVVGTDVNPLAPGLHAVDRPYIVPRISDDGYIDTVIEICRRESVQMVFPLIDPDVARLSMARSKFEAAGVQVAVIPPQSAQIVTDKWLTYQFFRQCDIPTPRSWLPQDVPPDEPFPIFIKPRFGSASEGTYKLNHPRELEFFSHYISQPIVQEYLPGAEITNDVLCDLSGRVVAVTSRKRLEVRGGEVVKGVTVYDPAITQMCITIAERLSAVGPITIQCIEKDGKPFFTEVNARFGGGLPLAIAAGVDFPGILLASQAGIPFAIPPIGSYKVGLYVSRFDAGYFIDEQARNEMAKHRL